MKLLCPTDFSNTSVNACIWASHFLELMGGGEIDILHCINVVSRSDIFHKMDDIFYEHAENDIRELGAQMAKAAPSIKINATIIRRDPKSYITAHLEENAYDFVVLGTQGLTAVKDLTIGSVTAYTMDRTTTPLLVIPETAEFGPFLKVMLAVDESPNNADLLQPLKRIVEKSGAELHVVHRTLEEDLPDNFNPFANAPIGQPYTFHSLHTGERTSAAITAFARDYDIHLVTMVHRRRGWLDRILFLSNTKEELFIIERPLLILPQ